MSPISTNAKHPAFKGVIAISGAAGRIGELLVRRLHRTDTVVSIDSREFTRRPTDVKHYKTALRRKECRDLFRRGDVDAVIHLAPYHARFDEAKRDEPFASAVENFARLLEYCDQYHVKKLILLSSADVYGARAGNPQFLSEEAPLLATWPASLRDIDIMAGSFFWKRPDIETVILRPAHIAGDSIDVMSRYLRLSPTPKLMGYDPMMQLVHEEDVVDAIRLSLKPQKRGIFNIAGPSPVPLGRILDQLGRATVPVPHFLAGPALVGMARLHKLDMDPQYLNHIKYVCMVDDARAKQTLGYSAKRDLLQTISAIDTWQ